MILLSILLACVDKDTESADTNTHDTSGMDTSMDQFKVVYCEEYAMRCNLYDSVEDCEMFFTERFGFDPACEIVDKDTFDICADWLLSLDCNVQGWIDECDQFYTCPD